MTENIQPPDKPEVVTSPPVVLTIKDIQDCVDESINSLEIADLKTLDANLEIALDQLDSMIDTLDDAITNRQVEKKDHEDLTTLQAPLLELKEAVEDQIKAVRGRIEDDMWIVIDGEVIDISKTYEANDECPAMIEEGRRDWYVDESSEEAGKRSRKRWESMAENDPKEFVCMVGEATLIQWGMGHYAGPGSTQVKSLEEWLDLHLDTPEEEFASEDGEERDVDFCSEALESELGFTPTVAYRHN